MTLSRDQIKAFIPIVNEHYRNQVDEACEALEPEEIQDQVYLRDDNIYCTYRLEARLTRNQEALYYNLDRDEEETLAQILEEYRKGLEDEVKTYTLARRFLDQHSARTSNLKGIIEIVRTIQDAPEEVMDCTPEQQVYRAIEFMLDNDLFETDNEREAFTRLVNS